MSIEAITWALNAEVDNSTSKLVLIGYANHAHKDGRNAWASKDTIAEYARCDAKTVRRHVRTLIADGWMRLGDQQQVAHVRPDRRPLVYDVAMSEAQRLEWKAAAAAEDTHTERGDKMTGRPDATGGQAVRPSTSHGGTNGGTPRSERGDTAVSPEPSGTLEPTPLPPADSTSSCSKPGPVPHVNCRGCATTGRQLAAAQAQRRDEERRAADLAARDAERRRLREARVPTEDRPPGVVALIQETRRTLTSRSR